MVTIIVKKNFLLQLFREREREGGRGGKGEREKSQKSC